MSFGKTSPPASRINGKACGPGTSRVRNIDGSSAFPSRPCFAQAKHIKHIWSLALHMYPMFWLAAGCVRMLEVSLIPSGRTGVRQGKYGSRLAFHCKARKE